MSDFTNTVRCNICGETSAYDDIDCLCKEEDDGRPETKKDSGQGEDGSSR